MKTAPGLGQVKNNRLDALAYAIITNPTFLDPPEAVNVGTADVQVDLHPAGGCSQSLDVIARSRIILLIFHFLSIRVELSRLRNETA